MKTQDKISNEIGVFLRALNDKKNVPGRCYRRNVSIYELVSYVNNITGCYLSENYDPIPVFIERARNYISENKSDDLEKYYDLVKQYFTLMEKYLSDTP